MGQALALAKLFSATEVDWALGHAAVHARFAEADLASILDHHHTSAAAGPIHQAGEDHSLTQGTAGWAGFGGVAAADDDDDDAGAGDQAGDQAGVAP